MTGERTASAVAEAARAADDAAWDGELNSIRLRCGPGRLTELGTLAAELGLRRVLLVGDGGVRRAGHLAAAESSLAAAGLEIAVFDQVEANPTTRHVEAGAAFATGRELDGVVAVGGGSVMDCAKGINFLLTNGGRMEDYWGRGKARRPLLPAIAVPTTAGTGSDAQSFAVITQADTGRKMACGDPGARFRAALLDPRLAATAPREVRAAAGIDALSHALESYVSRSRTPISALLGREAWQMLDASIEAGLGEAAGEDTHGRLLLGAHLAGAAIEASMLGAAHAAANPLTARFGVAHGVALGLTLPPVLRFNGTVAGDLYRELAPGGAEGLAARIEALRAAGGLPETLEAVGVPREALPELARLATAEWTGGFNPRRVGEREFLGIYGEIG